MPPKKTEIVKASRWSPDPKPLKGYYIDKDTIYNGVDQFTGRIYQRYTMISLEGGMPTWFRFEEQQEWKLKKEDFEKNKKRGK